LQAAGLVVSGDAHILAIEVGEESKAVCAAQALQQRGLLVFAARYPTVPEGRAMLRVSVTAAHTQEDLTLLATAMQEVLG
jgi:8-amino-7-oxononanoate synthase